MMKLAFPGSFDPLTYGHIDIIGRAVALCDELYVVVEDNINKKYMFGTEDRFQIVKKYFENNSKVIVKSYKGMTVDFCKEYGIDAIVRGVRNASDLEYEKTIAAYNNDLSGIETVFLLTDPVLEHYSSSGVRELIRYGRDITDYVPEIVSQYIKNYN